MPNNAVGQPILVLSYNVSFEASTNWTRARHPDSPYPTAWELGETCVETAGPGSMTVCAERQAALIDSIPAAGSNYDFVGLQEASRSANLQAAATRTLARLQCERSLRHGAEMASFFDDAKYRLRHKVTHREIGHVRPYHLLIVDAREGSGTVIFVNLHNGHSAGYEPLAGVLTEGLDSMQLEPAELEDLQSARIIVAGDFNMGTAQAWAPFAPTLTSTVDLTNPPKTCCASPDGDFAAHQPSWPGDLIFDSATPAAPRIPASYPYDQRLSDHLPVVAALDPLG